MNVIRPFCVEVCLRLCPCPGYGGGYLGFADHHGHFGDLASPVARHVINIQSVAMHMFLGVSSLADLWP